MNELGGVCDVEPPSDNHRVLGGRTEVKFPEPRIEAMMVKPKQKSRRVNQTTTTKQTRQAACTPEPIPEQPCEPPNSEHAVKMDDPFRALAQLDVLELTKEERERWEQAALKHLQDSERGLRRFDRLPVTEKVLVIAERHERISKILMRVSEMVDQMPADAWDLLGDLCWVLATFDVKIGCLSDAKWDAMHEATTTVDESTARSLIPYLRKSKEIGAPIERKDLKELRAEIDKQLNEYGEENE